MSVIKTDFEDDNNSLDVAKEFIHTAIGFHPQLKHINVNYVTKAIESGIGDGCSDRDLLTFISETCASLTFKSYDYALLAGRIDVLNLYKTTEDTFIGAMKRVKDLLEPQFYKKICENDYDSLIKGDEDFNYDIIGIRTLRRSYLLRDKDGKIVERPQYMLMRTAVFLNDDMVSVRKCYDALRQRYYTHASPTLFNAGTRNSQLASCFLLPVEEDSLEGIYDTLKVCAQISKLAGGIGFSVSNIRSKNSPIRKLNGKSDGIVPMLQVYNHTSRYVNQAGKRKGAFSCYLEPHHPDVEDWLQLKLNHGDESARARDLFYALWIPDEFMYCVKEDKDWHLICPSDAPDLQDLFGEEYTKRYYQYVKEGKYKKKMKARALWSLICRVQIETGNPYILYKDAVNLKNNQSNLGTIRSSNLCAEICEYSSRDEVAVCTLASICLPKFIGPNGFDWKKLKKAAFVACKNLNKVIDKTSYPVPQAKYSNLKNRPIGIGVQGLSDVFQMLFLPYDSEEAKEVNQKIFETIYYGAMNCSIELAKEKGPYESFQGSPLSEGKFQFDLWNVTPKHYDFNELREKLMKYGARNSLLVACMPTASTAQINGNTESFEPATSNLYVRRVLSGEFMVINKHLEKVCRKHKLWTEDLVNSIIKDKGSVQNTTLPSQIKELFKTVWEISNKSLIDLSANRAPYVCQSQSLNLYLENPNESTISSMQFYAWMQGLKTGMYYLRTRAKASAIQFTCDSCSA